MSLFIRVALPLVVAECLRTRGQAVPSHSAVAGGSDGNEAYEFDDFVRDFGRTYDAGSDEYARRAAIFQDSMLQIHAKNARFHRSWTAGVHPFMDWTDAERAGRLHGYRPAGREPRPLAALQTGQTGTITYSREYGGAGDSFANKAPPVRNQGSCGSCWAIASVEAVEAQLIKANSSKFQQGHQQLSPQALLDCVQNPKHCGGQGGCDGATPQLAFDFMQQNGLPLESNLPYSQKAAERCPIQPYPSDWARVTVTGWRALPSNQAQPLMQALVEDGPVVVSVYAHDWYSYQSGIFDDCPKDAIPSHSVLATGYGVLDKSSGMQTSITMYWLLQNSWGTEWGEQGSIRVIRHEDEDSWCGTDSQPQMGSACDDDSHQNVTVCGSCGLLYDTVIPQVGVLDVPTARTARQADKAEAIWEQYHAAVDEPRQPAAVDDPQQPSTTMATTTQPAVADAPSDSEHEGGLWPASQAVHAAAAPQPEDFFALRNAAAIAAQDDESLASYPDRFQASAPESHPDVDGARPETDTFGHDARAQDVHESLFAMRGHEVVVTDAIDAYEAGALQG